MSQGVPLHPTGVVTGRSPAAPPLTRARACACSTVVVSSGRSPTMTAKGCLRAFPCTSRAPSQGIPLRRPPHQSSRVRLLDRSGIKRASPHHDGKGVSQGVPLHPTGAVSGHPPAAPPCQVLPGTNGGPYHPLHFATSSYGEG